MTTNNNRCINFSKEKMTNNTNNNLSYFKWKSQLENDKEFKVGDLVLCPFPGNTPILETWYWGKILRKFKVKISNFYRYSIEFVDDGDFYPEVSSKDLLGLNEYYKLLQRGLLSDSIPCPTIYNNNYNNINTNNNSLCKITTDSSSSSSSNNSSSSRVVVEEVVSSPLRLKQHRQIRCYQCCQCKRIECGKCTICLQNLDMSSPSTVATTATTTTTITTTTKKMKTLIKKQDCVQKMCLAIPTKEKARQCEGFPVGWRFFFVKETLNKNCHGLLIVSPQGRHFRTVDVAISVNKLTLHRNEVIKFYKSVGLSPPPPEKNYTTTRMYSLSLPSSSSSSSSSLCHYDGNYYNDDDSSSHNNNNFGSMTKLALNLYELWDMRCQVCNNCIRKDCMKCISCKRNEQNNKKSSSSSTSTATMHEVCLQRMCGKIHVSMKAQKAPYFPNGWRFVFQSTSDNPNGLILLAPKNGLRYVTVENAIVHNKRILMKENKNIICPFKFYEYVGLYELNNTDTDTTTTEKEENGGNSSGGIIRSEVSSSLSSSSSSLHIRNDENHEQEEKMATTPRAEEDDTCSGKSYQIINNNCKRRKKYNVSKTLNPFDLYKQRCKLCTLCRKPDCQRCATCLRNASRSSRSREVCFRKMCTKIPIEKKVRTAPGLPEGCCFYWEEWHPKNVTVNSRIYIDPDLRGLRIVGLDGRSFLSIDSARTCMKRTLVGSFHDDLFLEHIGGSVFKEIKNHFLHSKGYSCEWRNVLGERRSIYGVITKVEKHILNKTIWCTVKYDEELRMNINSQFAQCKYIRVPKIRKISLQLAWSGWVHFSTTNRQKMMESNELELTKPAEIPFFETWLIPDIIVCTSTTNTNSLHSFSNIGHLQLRLMRKENVKLEAKKIININGFQLTFTAKPSTIPNAGNGIFLKCLPLRPIEANIPCFQLQAGTLLDIGVYAPLGPQDKKREYLFRLKNFVHNFKCEEYCFGIFGEGNERTFDHDEYYLDITDNCTGELHELARKNITSYVNEVCDENQIATVHARYDCEGALHYMLGHEQKEHGPFTLIADGREIEIFANYGPGYENIRLRKGYTRLPQNAIAEATLRLHQEQQDYLKEIDTFNAFELYHCINYFNDILTLEQHFDDNFKERCFVVALLLKKRARHLMIDFANMGDGDDIEFCDNGITDFDLPKLVDDAGKIILKLYPRGENVGRTIKERLLPHPIFRNVIKDILGQVDLSRLRPTELQKHICGI